MVAFGSRRFAVPSASLTAPARRDRRKASGRKAFRHNRPSLRRVEQKAANRQGLPAALSRRGSPSPTPDAHLAVQAEPGLSSPHPAPTRQPDWFTDEAVAAWVAEPRTTGGGQPLSASLTSLRGIATRWLHSPATAAMTRIAFTPASPSAILTPPWLSRHAALVHNSGDGRRAPARSAFRRCAATLACRGGSSGSAPSSRPWPRCSGQIESGREGCCR